jgi:hypothetical protein
MVFLWPINFVLSFGYFVNFLISGTKVYYFIRLICWYVVILNLSELSQLHHEVHIVYVAVIEQLKDLHDVWVFNSLPNRDLLINCFKMV